MAAEFRSCRLIATLSATTVDPNSTGATSAATTAAVPTPTTTASAKSLAEEPAEGIQSIQLARQEIAKITAISAQQHALSGSQENRPRNSEYTDASRSGVLRDGDETK